MEFEIKRRTGAFGEVGSLMWIPELSLWPDMEDGEKQEGNWVWRGEQGSFICPCKKIALCFHFRKNQILVLSENMAYQKC